jgi:hypothetical protein
MKSKNQNNILVIFLLAASVLVLSCKPKQAQLTRFKSQDTSNNKGRLYFADDQNGEIKFVLISQIQPLQTVKLQAYFDQINDQPVELMNVSEIILTTLAPKIVWEGAVAGAVTNVTALHCQSERMEFMANETNMNCSTSNDRNQVNDSSNTTPRLEAPKNLAPELQLAFRELTLTCEEAEGKVFPDEENSNEIGGCLCVLQNTRVIFKDFIEAGTIDLRAASQNLARTCGH